jgi:hypothetical protein
VSLMSWAKCTGRARRMGLGDQVELSPGVGMVVCPILDMRPFFFGGFLLPEGNCELRVLRAEPWGRGARAWPVLYSCRAGWKEGEKSPSRVVPGRRGTGPPRRAGVDAARTEGTLAIQIGCRSGLKLRSSTHLAHDFIDEENS